MRIPVVIIISALSLLFACETTKTDAVSGATQPVSKVDNLIITVPDIQNEKTKAIIFLYSNGNTKKIANAIALKINASVLYIEAIDNNKINFSALEEYELIGFGSGIDSDKHFRPLLDFAEKLPNTSNKKAFVFSTCGVYDNEKMINDHKTLKTILHNKGFITIGDFSCPGHNTNSFLKIFGGLNKGRPNANDLRNAEKFAETLLSK
jgi:flavodoxin